jgi:hypothetical protein
MRHGLVLGGLLILALVAVVSSGSPAETVDEPVELMDLEAVFGTELDASLWSATAIEIFVVDGSLASSYHRDGRSGPEFEWVEILGGQKHAHYAIKRGPEVSGGKLLRLQTLMLSSESYSPGSHWCIPVPKYGIKIRCDLGTRYAFVSDDCLELRLVDETGESIAVKTIAARSAWSEFWKDVFPECALH